jgi:hypothetical protein
MIPKKLLRLQKKLGTRRKPASFRTIASFCGVNVRWVSDTFNGIEPRNPVIRKVLGFPKLARRARVTKVMLSQLPHRAWWRRLSVNDRDACIWNEHKIYLEVQKEEQRNEK